MTNNGDVYKKTIEDDLQEVKKCKIHILMIHEKNAELCAKNNEEIKRLSNIIENRLISAEDSLNKSGEKKIDTPVGYCSFRVQPDKWSYDIPKLTRWAKEDEVRANTYIRVYEDFRIAQFKKDYADGIITHDDVCDEGLTISKQEPKFGYKIKEVI